MHISHVRTHQPLPVDYRVKSWNNYNNSLFRTAKTWLHFLSSRKAKKSGFHWRADQKFKQGDIKTLLIRGGRGRYESGRPLGLHPTENKWSTLKRTLVQFNFEVWKYHFSQLECIGKQSRWTRWIIQLEKNYMNKNTFWYLRKRWQRKKTLCVYLPFFSLIAETLQELIDF